MLSVCDPVHSLSGAALFPASVTSSGCAGF